MLVTMSPCLLGGDSDLGIEATTAAISVTQSLDLPHMPQVCQIIHLQHPDGLLDLASFLDLNAAVAPTHITLLFLASCGPHWTRFSNRVYLSLHTLEASTTKIFRTYSLHP
jgi:hypothetical protein